MKELREKLKKTETDRDAMKAQSEGLQEEYERVTELLREAEVTDLVSRNSILKLLKRN